MFINSRKIVININRLAARNVSYNSDRNGKPIIAKKLHTTTRPNYAAAAILPIPNNIDAAETTRFSPHRARDISATVIISHYNQSMTTPNIDITVDNSSSAKSDGNSQDPHVQSYDCFGAVSLNSAMQSNVPSPFGGMHKFSHLNMPGGQWSQECKFTSQNLHSSHYTALRDSARSGWVTYDQDATVDRKKEHATANWIGQSKRSYSTKVETEKKPENVLTKKEQLKKAFKEYGATVVIFHVAISLASLGGCYILVSGGIDMMPVLEYLGLASTALANKVAAGASTFVVAYAIHKVFAPVRISITLGATPFIVRYLRSKGFLKPKIIKKE